MYKYVLTLYHKSFPDNRIIKNISGIMSNESPLSKLCAKRALSN